MLVFFVIHFIYFLLIETCFLSGQVLHTIVLYLHDFKANKMAEKQKIVTLVKTHR